MERRKKITNILLLLALFGVLALIFTMMTTPWTFIQSEGSDKRFHLQRLAETAMNFKNFDLTYIMTSTFGSTGQGINFFYPAAGLLPYLLAINITGSLVHGFFIGTFIRTIIGLSIGYLAIRMLGKSSKFGIFFSTSYVFSTYMMFDALPRFDLGEVLGLLILPLVFSTFYLLLTNQGKPKLNIVVLALSLALVTYCHLMALLIVLVLMIIIYVGYTLWNWTSFKVFGTSLLRFFVTGIIFLLLTMAFMIPFIEQYVNTEIRPPNLFNVFGIPGHGLQTLSEIFETSLSNNLGIGKVTLGLFVLIGIFYVAFNYKKLSKLSRFAYISGLALTLISTNIFPWAVLRNTPVALIQMPARFLPIASLFLIYVITDVTVQQLETTKFRLTWQEYFMNAAIMLIPVIFAAGSTIVFFVNHEKTPFAGPNDTVAAPGINRLWENVDWKKPVFAYSFLDYRPVSDFQSFKFAYGRQIDIAGEKVALTDSATQARANGLTYKIERPKNQTAKVTLPFWIYKESQYSLTVNGDKTKLTKNQNNLAEAVVNLVAGKNKITVQYNIPDYYKVANGVSVVGVVLSLLFSALYLPISRKAHAEKG